MRWAAVLVAVVAIGLCGELQTASGQAVPVQGSLGKSDSVVPSVSSPPASAKISAAPDRATLRLSRDANDIANEANHIARLQADYSVAQLVLAAMVMCLTGAAAVFAWRATVWAKAAAHHTGRTADIAAAETRPWIALRITPLVVRWNANKSGVLFQYDAEFQNVGKTVACDFFFYAGWAFEGDGAEEAIREHRSQALERRSEGGFQALLPGETWTWPGWSGLSVKTIHWLDRGRLRKRMMPVLLMTAFYRAAGSETWLVTERFFSIVRSEDADRRSGIADSELDLTAKDLLAWPRGGTHTE